MDERRQKRLRIARSLLTHNVMALARSPARNERLLSVVVQWHVLDSGMFWRFSAMLGMKYVSNYPIRFQF